MNWKLFANNRDRVTSRTGGWTSNGKVTLHGFDLHEEIVPNATWMQTLALSITGRLYPANEARLMEAMLVVTGYPDPRLWCNRIAALGGSMRVPATAALSASMASAEAKLYGWQATYHAALLINKVKLLLDNEKDEEINDVVRRELSAKRSLAGFGRPLTGIEERIAPLEALCGTLHIASGPHLAAARKLESMLKNRRLFLNYGGYVAVRLLDLGFSPVEAYRISIIGFYIGFMPCYIEAFENEPGTFLPIACEDILYEGREERPLSE